MNALRKKAAVENYKVVFTNGATVEELKEALAQDAKQYTPEEIDEIVTAITAADGNNGGAGEGDKDPAATPNPSTAPAPAPAPEQPNANQLYAEHRVENKNAVMAEFRKEGTEFDDSCFEKGKHLRDTAITAERAELLNSQSANTGVRLYKK